MNATILFLHFEGKTVTFISAKSLCAETTLHYKCLFQNFN